MRRRSRRIVVDEAEFARLPTQMAMYPRRPWPCSPATSQARSPTPAAPSIALADDDLLGRGAAAALLGLAHWSLGDLERRRSIATPSPSRCFEQAEYYADVLGCSRALADIQSARGHLGAAISTLESGLELARAHGPLRGTADMHAGLSELFLERNDLEAARSHAQAERRAGRSRSRFRRTPTAGVSPGPASCRSTATSPAHSSSSTRRRSSTTPTIRRPISPDPGRRRPRAHCTR